MNIVLLGAPGAGKGTQAVIICEKYAIPHISTGEILRNNIKNQTELGKKAKECVEAGNLVSDELVIEMVKDRLSQSDCEKGFILDGFPRNYAQAQALTTCLDELGKKIEYALNFDASEEVILTRLTGRRVCESCGATYHVTNMPPKKENECDQCSGMLVQRKDDQVDTIKNRLLVYRESAQPLIDYYDAQGVLQTIQADLGHKEIDAILDGLLSA